MLSRCVLPICSLRPTGSLACTFFSRSLVSISPRPAYLISPFWSHRRTRSTLPSTLPSNVVCVLLPILYVCLPSQYFRPRTCTTLVHPHSCPRAFAFSRSPSASHFYPTCNSVKYFSLSTSLPSPPSPATAPCIKCLQRSLHIPPNISIFFNLISRFLSALPLRQTFTAGRTPLHRAADVEVARALLDNGALVNYWAEPHYDDLMNKTVYGSPLMTQLGTSRCC